MTTTETTITETVETVEHGPQLASAWADVTVRDLKAAVSLVGRGARYVGKHAVDAVRVEIADNELTLMFRDVGAASAACAIGSDGHGMASMWLTLESVKTIGKSAVAGLKPSDTVRVEIEWDQAEGSFTVGTSRLAGRVLLDDHGRVSGREVTDDHRTMYADPTSDEFRRIGAAVAVGASKDDARPILTCVAFGGPLQTGARDDVMAVATDSYRLHMLALEHGAWSDMVDPDLVGDRAHGSVMVLADVWRKLAPTAKGQYGPRTFVAVDERNNTRVSSATATMRWVVECRGVFGDFPNYRQLIPTADGNYLSRVNESASAWSQIIGAPSVEQRPVRVSISDTGGSVWSVGGDGADVWSARTNGTVTAERPESGGLVAAFNPQFVAATVKALRAVYGNDASFVADGADHLKPWLFTTHADSLSGRGLVTEPGSACVLLMPVRVS